MQRRQLALGAMVASLIAPALAAFCSHEAELAVLELAQHAGHGLGRPVRGEHELSGVSSVGDHGVGSDGSTVLNEQTFERLEVVLHLGGPLPAGPLALRLELVHGCGQLRILRQAFPVVAEETQHGGQLGSRGRGRPVAYLVDKLGR